MYVPQDVGHGLTRSPADCSAEAAEAKVISKAAESIVQLFHGRRLKPTEHMLESYRHLISRSL
jgi:hypothetical protein